MPSDCCQINALAKFTTYLILIHVVMLILILTVPKAVPLPSPAANYNSSSANKIGNYRKLFKVELMQNKK